MDLSNINRVQYRAGNVSALFNTGKRNLCRLIGLSQHLGINPRLSGVDTVTANIANYIGSR